MDNSNSQVTMLAPAVGLKIFGFDQVFAPETAQHQVYNSTAQRSTMDFINGFNAAMIVFGQTGSGKTFTMFGPDHSDSSSRGIVPRAIQEVFSVVTDRSDRIEARLAMSCVEVYGIEINDLLQGGRPVGQSKAAAQKYVLEGNSEVPITDLKHAEDLLAQADTQKRRAATAMNERSSRAHAVVVLSLAQRHRYTGIELNSKLFLADLGGSEQVKKSKVSGVQMQEAIFINQGLFALGQCVDALNEGREYVPYQTSKLTMLLSEALGGDSKTTIVVTAGAEDTHALETYQAMRFGERFMAVQNEADIGMNTMGAALEALNAEIDDCEEYIRVTERWETRIEERADERAGLHIDEGANLDSEGASGAATGTARLSSGCGGGSDALSGVLDQWRREGHRRRQS